jgi:D-glycero-D-manno-heptose 1,7-bisphosphate phosphatase
VAAGKSLILLDRDGVLNAPVDNPAEPRPDSPLRAADVVVFPWVPGVLRDLTRAGFGIAIVSNQPAAAKGKTTRAELQAVHAAVVLEATSAGGVIVSSHICFHRAEDACTCRKPATGLLAEAFARNPGHEVGSSWIVGDRASDILAGVAFGVQTALVGDVAAEDRALLAARTLTPTFEGRDLRDFAARLGINDRG